MEQLALCPIFKCVVAGPPSAANAQQSAVDSLAWEAAAQQVSLFGNQLQEILAIR
jgi:hypothetical protein